jgi:hypothetical protein
MDTDYWELKFSVEVSAMYHDWRRGSLWFFVQFVKAVTLAGVIATLLTAFIATELNTTTTGIIAGVSAAIGIVTLMDLIWNFSARAQLHDQLYQRFKALQAELERLSRNTESWPELSAKAQAIRVDEPPTLWAIYAQCWNQAIEHHAAEHRGYYRKIAGWRRALGSMLRFGPQDFPAVTV